MPNRLIHVDEAVFFHSNLLHRPEQNRSDKTIDLPVGLLAPAIWRDSGAAVGRRQARAGTDTSSLTRTLPGGNLKEEKWGPARPREATGQSKRRRYELSTGPFCDSAARNRLPGVIFYVPLSP